MSPLQFLPTLKSWVSLEGFYHIGYQPLNIEIRGEPEMVQKLINAIHEETDTWGDFQEC